MENQRKEYKKFSREVIFVAIAQWLPKLKGFIILPFIIKILGAEKYGIWSQLLVTLSLIYPFSILGLNTAFRRFLPGKEDKAELRNDFWAAIFLIFFNALILSVGFYFLSPHFVKLFFKTEETLTLLYLVAILIPLSAINQIFLESFVTFGQSKKYIFFILGKEIIEIPLIIYFLLHGKGLFALLAISIGTLALSTVLAGFIFIKQLGISWPKFRTLKPYFQLGLPLFFSGFAYWVFHVSDRYVIGYFFNIKLVGIYSGIYNLTTIIFVIAGPVCFVLLPTISKFWEENEIGEVKKYLKYSLKYFFMLGIPAIFGLSVLGRQFLEILTTDEFVSWWYLIPIIGGALVIFQGLRLGEYVLILAKKTSIILKYIILAALMNVLLNIIFVPIFGILGAAITSFISCILYGITIWFVSRKYLVFDLDYQFLIKCVLASVLMSFPLIIFNPQGIKNLLVFIPISILIYGLALIVFRGLSIQEIKILLKRRN